MTRASVSPASLLTPAEACERLRRSSETLAALVTEGRLSAYRFPDGSLGFLPADVDAVARPVPPSQAADELLRRPKPTTAHSPTTAASAEPLLGELRQLVAELRQQRGRTAQWMDARHAAAVFGLDRKRLDRWARSGRIRRAKLGETPQAKALYAAEDIAALLDAIAQETMGQEAGGP